jgi:hypothetical protein
MELPEKMSAKEFQDLIKKGVLDCSGKKIKTNNLLPEYEKLIITEKEKKPKPIVIKDNKLNMNDLLSLKFEQYLKNKFGDRWAKEVLFSKINPEIKRKFRADYFIPEIKTIIEINGGEYGQKVVCNHCGTDVKDRNGKQVFSQGGRHTRSGGGYENDLYKMNLAQKMNLKYFQFNYQQLKDDIYKEFI